MDSLGIISMLVALIILGIVIYLIVSQVREGHLAKDPMLHQLKATVAPLHPKIKDLKFYKGKRSYTINKEKIYLCLYDENGNYYPINDLLHVTIHEVAHALNQKDVGHTEEFHKIFEDLLEKAAALGIYDPNEPMTPNYCQH